MGDFSNISLESGLNQNGTAGEGYFVFGCLSFQSDVSLDKSKTYSRSINNYNDTDEGDVSSRSVSNITPKKPEIVTCMKRSTSLQEIDQTSDLASSTDMKESSTLNQRLQKVEELLEEVIKNQSNIC